MRAHWLPEIARLAAVLAALVATPSFAASLPAGFVERELASGLVRPTTMAFAPDGRLFVAQQDGALRVIKDGVLLVTPFVSLTVDGNGERGLLGIAFDPNFATDPYVYVYYTSPTPTIHNRLSRFAANGDTAAPGSETVILDLDDLTNATNHNGGAIHFGPDGKLYVGVGENAAGANAQTLSNLLGKVLRINADGSIPADNPFVASAAGRNRAIWALGLRNPYTFAFAPWTGTMFINDVGAGTYEEIDVGIRGANYGWPLSEGPTGAAGETPPIYSYDHGSGPFRGCAISGAAFYDPPIVQFPSAWRGRYFFADYCGGWINVLDPAAGNAVTTFASGIAVPVDVQVGPDGNLYYLARGEIAADGSVTRVAYGTLDAPAPPANYQGAWWHYPAGSESGWGINFAHQGDTITATWFTFGFDGKPLWLIVAAAKIGPNVYAGDLYTGTGPPYEAVPFDPAKVVPAKVGTATFTFTDNQHATFASTVNGIAQTKPITREVFAYPVPSCAWNGGTPPAAASSFQDLWWAAPAGSESGWGVYLAHQGDTILATWFTYGLDGNPTWFVVAASRVTANVYAGDLYTGTGPAFNAGPFDSDRIAATKVGTATFTFGDGNNASFAYTVNGASRTKAITREVFAPPGTVCR